MPKDTKSLDNNKAPACESRGFVHKKKKACILTHLHGKNFYGQCFAFLWAMFFAATGNRIWNRYGRIFC